MKILIMGEESQAVCSAFRNKGHEAFSVDYQECSGGHPEWHIEGDMFDAFYDLKPEMIIVHPTCTFMCNSGALRLYVGGKKENGIDLNRWRKMENSANEFKRILQLPIDMMCVENPIMHCHAKKIIGVKQSQIIQPFQFSHPESKATCLWLKGLPNLKPTEILSKPYCGYWENQSRTGSGQNRFGKGSGKLRSKTHHGIAQAMANQWG